MASQLRINYGAKFGISTIYSIEDFWRNKFSPYICGYFFCEELIIRKHNFSKIGSAVSAKMVSQVCRDSEYVGDTSGFNNT